MDPHTTQAATPFIGERIEADDESASAAADRRFHTRRPGRMDMRQLDPSLALVSCMLPMTIPS